ncbi:NACHT, LRR and PYD domains-containing protein 10 [Holothuria leucospilota]|uniref:NACHT, LRR and PYD domains-containing protein 10 n=1 Tax=Holothuria leucospilota TaxID=206669 RepID=A0A9Q1CPB6_HOLLE|nr:NACHT, LRR and PYD domains-containing protein 10 [Holothuria leucospilota]
MAVNQQQPAPLCCISCSRFKTQDGWRLRDISVNALEEIAVSGGNINTFMTFIEVFFLQNEFRNKPTLLYLQEFAKYETKEQIYYLRYVSFMDLSSDCNKLVTCLGNKLDVIHTGKNEVLQSREVNGSVRCVFVRKGEVFIGFFETNEVAVYESTDLNQIKSIILEGIQDDEFPFDMHVTGDKVYVCAGKDGEDRPLSFSENTGQLLSDFTRISAGLPFARGVTANIHLGVVAFVWANKEREGNWQVGLYDVQGNGSLMSFAVERCVPSIRFTQRGDKMVTGNRVTGEVKIYVMAEVFTYHHLKQKLNSHIKLDDCVRLMGYFALPNDWSEVILKSQTPAENLMQALEERRAVRSSNVDGLIEAFRNLGTKSVCYHLVVLYKNTRMQETAYDRFLASLSAHLTATLPGDLCKYFNISDEKKRSIMSAHNPGLSLLLALDKFSIIKSSEVGALIEPFGQFKLVQALVKIHEYQSITERGSGQLEVEADGKNELFIRCLQRKIRSWYETMTPVPWKKSCKWKSTELFVGGGLILTNSKAKKSMKEIDEHCKLQYTDIFTHERLKSESRLVLEGDPGCGKTMLASQLAYDWSKGKVGEIDILIFLPLKFVGCKPLAESIWEFYVPENIDLSVADIEDLIRPETSKCCFILDGFEEYGGKGNNSDVMQIMTRSKYPSCKAILTTRSEFAHNLPLYPMLKLCRFGDTERNMYIAKVFSGDLKKQLEVKTAIKENPFLLDLCSVPLLLVLAVHNFDSMGPIPKGYFDKVTIFMQKVVETLCPFVISRTKTDGSDLHSKAQGKISLEEMAFNGLCRGHQQLSWEKVFIEMSTANSKLWLDTGILVVDESPLLKGKMDQHKSLSSRLKHTPSVQDLDSVRPNIETDGQSTYFPSDDSTSSRVQPVTDEVVQPVSDKISTFELYSDQKQNNTFSVAKHVSLQVKFLHKIMQEWFAAKYLCFMVSRLNSLHDRHKYLSETLPLINPTDLHYILRFSCALHPCCAHIIMKHLLTKYHSNEDDLPEFYRNCVFLCFSEYGGDPGPDILEVVKMVCKENITISSEDSRLLQQAKVSMMQLASASGIMISKVFLVDLVMSATKEALTFNSGVKMEALGTLHYIKISRWDQTLKEEDYPGVVKFVAKCTSLQKASFNFPEQPPRVDKETMTDLLMGNKTVTWTIGSRLCHTLDSVTGQWQIHMKSRQTSEEKSLPTESNTELLYQRFAETEAIITKNGSTVTIPGTKVELNIPQGALPEHIDECVIKMTVLSRKVFQDPSIAFSSHSSLVVEILPNNLLLQRPAQLVIPHCLLLKKKEESAKAKIFMSHHDEGCPPCWREHPEEEYRVERTHCVVSLKSFCWITIKIDDEDVLAKKLILYTSGKKLQPTDRYAEVAVGYYPDLDVEGKFLGLNKRMVVSKRMPFVFMKDGSYPLCLVLEKFSSRWELWSPEERDAEIPFKDVSASLEIPYLFILEKAADEARILMCMFKVFQEKGQQPVKLSICSEDLDSQHDFFSEADNNPTRVHVIKSETNTDNLIRFLSKNIREEWMDVGRCLHISEATLSSIKADNFNNRRECIYQMLLSWKEQRGSEATFNTLATALMKADRKDLAEHVKVNAAPNSSI